MKFILYPGRGASNLEFGMPVELVRKLVNQPFDFFKRGIEPTDHFVALGLLAIYDDEGALYGLEFTKPAAPTLDGIDLLAVSFPRAKQILRLKGGPITERGVDAQSASLGINLWAPDFDEKPPRPCVSMSINRPDPTPANP